jgi:hypothetical protein
MRVDLLLALDRAQCGQFVANQVELEITAFAFNFDLDVWQLRFQEAFNFYGLHA